MLDEVFEAPLNGMPSFHPLVVDVKERQMVASWAEEGLSGRVGVDEFVFG
jgi:hypothetical protein